MSFPVCNAITQVFRYSTKRVVFGWWRWRRRWRHFATHWWLGGLPWLTWVLLGLMARRRVRVGKNRAWDGSAGRCPLAGKLDKNDACEGLAGIVGTREA